MGDPMRLSPIQHVCLVHAVRAVFVLSWMVATSQALVCCAAMMCVPSTQLIVQPPAGCFHFGASEAAAVPFAVIATRVPRSAVCLVAGPLFVEPVFLSWSESRGAHDVSLLSSWMPLSSFRYVKPLFSSRFCFCCHEVALVFVYLSAGLGPTLHHRPCQLAVEEIDLHLVADVVKVER